MLPLYSALLPLALVLRACTSCFVRVLCPSCLYFVLLLVLVLVFLLMFVLLLLFPLDCACGGSACRGSRLIGEARLVRSGRLSEEVGRLLGSGGQDLRRRCSGSCHRGRCRQGRFRFLPSRRMLGRAVKASLGRAFKTSAVKAYSDLCYQCVVGFCS